MTMTPAYFLLVALATSLILPMSVSSGLVLLVSVTLMHARKPLWRPARSIDALQVALLAWIPLSLFWSLSVGLALERVGTLLCMPLAYFSWRRMSSHPLAEQGLRSLLWVLLVLLVCWGLLQGPETYTAKPQGPFNDPNTFAGVLGMLALPLLAKYLASDLVFTVRWQRTLALALFGATALVFFLIASRGATLALLIAAPPTIWFARGYPQFSRKMLLLAVAMLTAYFCADWIKTGDRDVFLRLTETLQEGDSIRFMLMRSAWAMIVDHPWLGTGLGSFRLIYPSYRMSTESVSGGSWVHNDYLQLWQEAGLPMLLILVALLFWIAREMWRATKSGKGDAETLLRMGYLSGALVVFIQAATNFMFYFSFIALVMGLYLGRTSESRLINPSTMQLAPRAWRMTVLAYGAILIFLLAGNVAVEILLDRGYIAARTFARLVPETSRYQLAYWLSILSPFHPTPQHVMATELKEMLQMMQSEGGMQSEMFDEALWRFETSQRLAPCYVPYGIDTLHLLISHEESNKKFIQSEKQVKKNLGCNPNHGLSIFYAGLLREMSGDKVSALRIWHNGIKTSIFFADRLILAAAILSRTTPGHEKELETVVGNLISAAHFIETHPGVRLNQQIWKESQYHLQAVNREGFIRLLLPYKK